MVLRHPRGPSLSRTPSSRCSTASAPSAPRSRSRCRRQADPDQELLQVNVRLAKRRQALLDTNRIERKAFREHARIENAVTACTRELATLLDERGFSQELLLAEPPCDGEAVLIVQPSDLHFNERVDLPSNRYDFSVAAARLARLLAVDILKVFLLDLRSEFALEVYGITGNESRVNRELGWCDELATDSYDLMIDSILKRGFAGPDGHGTEGIAFCGFQANELLFEVMGRTFLCLHGQQVGANLQKSIQEITGKYASRGITVDYTLFGHLHATAIGDYHARNASLVGSNPYSESGLNFCSKAAQNIHLVTAGSIDGIKVDLQDTSGIEPYPFVNEWEAYAPKSERKLHQKTVVYQVVV